MNKTTEALKLAEEALENYGIEGTKSVAGIKCTEALAAIRDALAEQEKQEPVAAYKDAPRTIYLQTGCDEPDPFNCGCSFNEWGDVSWCADKIHDTDIPYVRADYAAPVSAKREWVELTDDEISDAIHGKGSPLRLFDSSIRGYRAVIAAFKEKNK